MSSTRRRSTSWMRVLVNSPNRIDVASTKIHNPLHIDPFCEGLEMELSNTGENKILSENLTLDEGESEKGKMSKCLDDSENTQIKHCLESYFDFLHCLGVASFKVYGRKRAIQPCFLMQKVLFCFVSTLIILDAVKMLKLCITFVAKKGDLYRYVTIGHFVLYFIQRVYFITLVSCTGSKHMFQIFDELKAFTVSQRNHTTNKFNNAYVHAFSFGLVTLVTALIGALFGWITIGEEWSLANCVLQPSYDISLSIFMWTTNNTLINEQSTTLLESYGEVFTPVTVLLGVLGIAMDWFGLFSDYVVNDVMLFAAVTLHQLSKHLQIQMSSDESNVDEVLKQYKHLKKVSKFLEGAFGGLFKISHASNLLSCAYLLTIMVSDTEYDVGMVLLVLKILKVWITYYLTIKTTEVNKIFREWVRHTIIDNDATSYDMKFKAIGILDETNEIPLGLGADTFFIDEIFALKFATMVCTFSLFMIDSKKKSDLGEA